ncbi:PASTA domain-containing protein [Streptococcus moroccensis]|uniref:PASTA domain-containing protein n=1 Tax=Streptococcus moroccensis TaxID=1451356 RepID=A0ABT9YPH8_9STRE|nr:PASTA domain-containing protein [Streptococcus moroccensis]MDQ0221792.1 hypothetical protein [Streptococcus moroccensis]
MVRKVSSKKRVLKNIPKKKLKHVTRAFSDVEDRLKSSLTQWTPVFKGESERRRANHHNVINLADVTTMRLLDAITHLKRIGFRPRPILVDPDQKWSAASLNTVLDMQPKPGYYSKGTIVDIYYMDETIKELVDEQVELPVLKGLTLEAARELLERKGFKVSPELAIADKEYATAEVRSVVDFDPKPALFTTSLKRGSTITLYYTTQTTVNQSQQLLQEEMSKRNNIVDASGQLLVDKINEFLNR